MEAAGLFGADTLVFLEGEMGAGKSTFVRVLLEDLCPGAKSLGSPTFPLVQTYRTSGGMWIYHIDLYRLKSARELEDSGIEDQLEEKGALVFVEWGSLFEASLSFYLEHAGRIGKRVVKVLVTGESETTRNYLIEA